jgi:37-kD nucleoid-associated bacterial protein
VRNPSAINVDAAIVHLVRRSDSGGPFYSQVELELIGHGRLAAFLVSHIRNSLTHERTQSANFLRDASDAVVFRSVRALIDNRKNLVATSTLIAKHLHSAIETQRNASEAALVCCIYEVDNEPPTERFVGLLKLEPGGAFRPRQSKESGRRVVRLEELRDVLPSEREQLQKAALIRPPKDQKPKRGSFDMMVLDRQKRESPEPAGYFMDFLRAELALDPHAATWAVHNTVHRTVTEIRDLLSSMETQTVLSALRAGISSRRLEPVAMIETLQINDTAKNQLADAVRSAVTDRAFNPDPTVAAKLTRLRRFRADQDVSVSIDAEAARDASVFRTRADGEFTEVMLRVRNWREVAR